jgi:hypothetical protein
MWGKELDALEKKEKVELREESLLKGILYGLYEFDHSPNQRLGDVDKKTLLYLLDILTNGFGFKDPEKMILDTAFSVREINGSSASRIILETGRGLLPQSSGIKSDLILDLWAVISESKENQELLFEVLELLEQIDLNSIYPGAKEVICYYGFCATVFLNRESESFLEQYIYPNITAPDLKNRIFSLLENQEGFSPADMRIA